MSSGESSISSELRHHDRSTLDTLLQRTLDGHCRKAMAKPFRCPQWFKAHRDTAVMRNVEEAEAHARHHNYILNPNFKHIAKVGGH